MIVTRFAPSPTGYLHIGGARTALFCWLLARHSGGRMILRIEDTDQKRNTPTATQQVINDLRWLGIDWDEGPDVGGTNGPYLQSQRLDIYEKYARRLIETGDAYYCFETIDELQARRQEAQESRGGFVYRRPAVLPDDADMKKAKAQGQPVVVRFAIGQDKPIVVRDMIRGEVVFNPAELSDFVILKSDGFPTYHFACVVDDELMQVTHVVRGQEHLMNTPCHQALQDALGFRRPAYAHMSVTVSAGGGKLSKRERPKALRETIKTAEGVDMERLAAAGGITSQELEAFLKGSSTPDMPSVNAMAEFLGVHLPEINVVDFFRSGYIPEAMVNFLAFLGWNPGGDREIMTTEELVRIFDTDRLTKSNSLFDRRKLMSFNTEHIKMLDKDRLLVHFKNYLGQTGSIVSRASDEQLKRILRITEGARTLAEIEAKSRFLFIDDQQISYDQDAVAKVLLKSQGLMLLELVGRRLAGLEQITAQSVEKLLRGLAEENQTGLGKVAQPLRVALCGTAVSLPIFDSVDMLGIERTLKRIDFTIKKFRINF